MKNKFVDSVLKALEKDKENYKYLCYLPKTNELRLIKGRYKFVPENTYHWQVYDGRVFGNYVAEKRTKYWIYVGDL